MPFDPDANPNAEKANRETQARTVMQPDSRNMKSIDDRKACYWTALLTGDKNLVATGVESARSHLLAWLVQSVERFAKNAANFPEPCRTTRFGNEIKAIETPLRILRTILHSLNSDAFSFQEAIDHAGRCFAWDEKRLLKWKQDFENMEGLARWLPSLQQAQDYLNAAFPLDIHNLDQMRTSLLQAMHEPQQFFDSKMRQDFDERFLDYKKSYIDSYFLLHEDALHGINGLNNDEPRIDPVSLRNLDLLSGLQHTDKSYLNRVNLLAKWMHHNRCNLPLHQILETYPRCYCNFNPCGRQQPAGITGQINALIQKGLEYFRNILHSCSGWIMQELRDPSIDDNSRQQIAALLADGPMPPLRMQSVKTLNRMLSRHSTEFLTEIRKTSRRKTASG
jgi:hypothetical protein